MIHCKIFPHNCKFSKVPAISVISCMTLHETTFNPIKNIERLKQAWLYHFIPTNQ